MSVDQQLTPGTQPGPPLEDARGSQISDVDDAWGDPDVIEVWGDDVDDMSPGMTLKPPRHTASQPAHAPAPDPEEPTPDLSGQGYDLHGVLGEGGVGVVYRATQKSIERLIAVKMAKPGLADDAHEREKFLAEAMITGKLDHPNIVPIHDLSATAKGQPFYTMKMVRGTPWDKVLDEKTLPENIQILLDVCDAVSFAHSKGVIHRDLKPENVMLGEFGEVQLMDWGLGALVSEDGIIVESSATSLAGGTPAFMAPEMVTGQDAPIGIHSDTYLLGAILYRIVTGNPPHPGKRSIACLENARRNVIQPTQQSGVLVDIALRAMETDPVDRHPSAVALKQSILDYQAHAESINLCVHSREDLRRARDTRDYETFTLALFGFREALKLWRENADARAGLSETRREYARCAFEKGDLDLAASALDADDPDHQELIAGVAEAQHRREAAKRRLRLLKVVAISLTATVIVVLTVASIWIAAAERQAVAAKEAAIVAKEDAVAAQTAEAEQRRLAETAMVKAKEEEARAVRALSDLEKAYKDLVAAQEQEKRALAQAAASDQAASETRDELAKTGMLLDNTWWVFDQPAARQKQAAAAAAIEMPAELTLDLTGDQKLELVLVPPGDFVMGSPPKEEDRAADEHLHRVHISRAFYLGKYEVTEAQWTAATGAPPRGASEREVDPTLPASGVSYDQIVSDFLPALRERAPEGYEFRLPTEAEWEYACRAGSGTAYYAGEGPEALDSAGWFESNSDTNVKPVGGKQPNAFGLYDMHGNVAEICADCYENGFYLECPVSDPIGPREGDFPVLRGGNILNTAEYCRSAYRSYVFRQNQYGFVGLRLVLAPRPAETAAEAPTESARRH